MVRLRAAKIAGIAADIPALAVDDPGGADTLVLGWGSTYGDHRRSPARAREGDKVARRTFTTSTRSRATSATCCGLRQGPHPEMNLGQLRKLIRAEFLVDAMGYNKVRGRPFKSAEIAEALTALIEQ